MQNEKIKKIVATSLRSIGASFPVAASFSNAWNELESHQREKRVKLFMDEIRTQVEIHGSQITKLETMSQQAVDQFDHLISTVPLEASVRKIRLFARIFIESNLEASELGFDEKIWIVDCLHEISEADIAFLARFDRGGYKQLNWIVGMLTMVGDPKKVEEKAMIGFVSMKRLESKGLVSQAHMKGGGITGSTAFSEWTNSVLSLSFQLTPFGRKVIDFLKDFQGITSQGR